MNRTWLCWAGKLCACRHLRHVTHVLRQAARAPPTNLLLRLLALEDEHAALARDYSDATGVIANGRNMLEELLGRLAEAEAARAALWIARATAEAARAAAEAGRAAAEAARAAAERDAGDLLELVAALGDALADERGRLAEARRAHDAAQREAADVRAQLAFAGAAMLDLGFQLAETERARAAAQRKAGATEARLAPLLAA